MSSRPSPSLFLLPLSPILCSYEASLHDFVKTKEAVIKRDPRLIKAFLSDEARGVDLTRGVVTDVFSYIPSESERIEFICAAQQELGKERLSFFHSFVQHAAFLKDYNTTISLLEEHSKLFGPPPSSISGISGSLNYSFS